MTKEIPLQDIGPNHPAYLNQEELENPFLVGHDLTDNATLFTVRKMWWDFLYYTLSSNEADGLPASIRAEYLFLHKAIMKLIEADFLIDEWRLDLKIDKIKTLNAIT